MLEPKNELGVIVEFSEQASKHGFVITRIDATYPDALIEKDNQSYRVEFEFEASSFDQHGHDCRECDLIVCWINDSTDQALPILALSEPNWADQKLDLPTNSEREAYYWKRRALKAERTLRMQEISQPQPKSGTTPFSTAMEHVQ